MPGMDGTGPRGCGAGTGRMRGICWPKAKSFTSFLTQLILNNLVTVVGFIFTACAHVFVRRFYLQKKLEKELVLSTKPVEEKNSRADCKSIQNAPK